MSGPKSIRESRRRSPHSAACAGVARAHRRTPATCEIHPRRSVSNGARLSVTAHPTPAPRHPTDPAREPPPLPTPPPLIFEEQRHEQSGRHHHQNQSHPPRKPLSREIRKYMEKPHHFRQTAKPPFPPRCQHITPLPPPHPNGIGSSKSRTSPSVRGGGSARRPVVALPVRRLDHRPQRHEGRQDAHHHGSAHPFRESGLFAGGSGILR